MVLIPRCLLPFARLSQKGHEYRIPARQRCLPVLLVHREQIRSYFLYDQALRRNSADPPNLPAGYHQFREAYARDARSQSRFAYLEPRENGTPQLVRQGTRPTMEEVLGRDCDLRSQEEIDGGKVLNGAEAETLNSMLWEAADRIKRQRENSSRGYWRRRDRRDDHHRQRGPLADRFSDSPFNRPRSQKKSSPKPEKRSEKAKETAAPSEYSTDLSPDLGAFFEPFSALMPSSSTAGPSSVTLDQLAANEVFIEGGACDDAAFEEEAGEGEDEEMEADATTGDAA